MATTTARVASERGAGSILRVLPLAVACFAAGTDDMVIAGILPDISRDLAVSEAAAGQLVTAYALALGLGSPVLAVASARWPRRRVLAAGLGAFVALNLLTAAAPTYGSVLALRVLAGLAAALTVPAAIATAAMVAPEGKRGRYLAVVTTGTTAALVLGVPLGTWIGGTAGWRSTMLLVAALGAVAMAGMATLPAVPTGAAARLASRLAPLRNLAVLRMMALLVVAGTGGMMTLTYLFPVLRAAGDVDYRQMTMLFTLFGVAGAGAALLGGRSSDRFGPYRTLVVAEAGHGLLLWLLAAMAWLSGMPLLALAVAVVPLALAAWSLMPPIQAMLYELAPDSGAEAVGLSMSGLYVGASLGGAVGGLLLAHVGAYAIGLVGGVLQFAAILLLPRPSSRLVRGI